MRFTRVPGCNPTRAPPKIHRNRSRSRTSRSGGRRMKNPKARQDDLLLEELPAELLVYDQRSHRAHCLNATAAAVFRQADVSRTVAEIARGAGSALQAP